MLCKFSLLLTELCGRDTIYRVIFMLEYTLKRSRRKTLAAYVLDDATIEVRAPLNVSKTEIDKFIEERETTLRKYIEKVREKNEKKSEFELEIGLEILFLGEKCMIKSGEKTEIREGVFFVTEGSMKNQIVALYRLAAERIINERVEYFSRLTGNVPKSVKLNAARTRWGSCSAKGTINFSWFLIMANQKCVDYVVIHELSHLKHMNHSSAFWREVAKYEPEYKQRRLELRELSARLQTEMW